jgi:TPP-dependent pyruvate/acetoin dehydrogenase alpha subunit
MKVTNEIKQRMLFAMKRIRMVQNRIESRYLEDEMKTPVHLCIGQEAVSVGVCSALQKNDYISSNHRSHGHYLAKGGDLNALIAELYCRVTGCSKGYGGSMHLVDTSVGHMGSSSIVGGGIPIGTGLGLAISMKRQDKVSAIFFGDGAADEGVLYESINFAILKKLPVIYILENNQWSVCSHISNRQAGKNIFHHAPQKRLFTRTIDGNDVLRIYEVACEAVLRAKNGDGPSFIECETYRILGHAGCQTQDPEGYRDTCEIATWKEKCPVDNLEKRMIQENLLSLGAIEEMETRINAEIDQAFDYARQSAFPPSEEIQNYLFKE